MFVPGLVSVSLRALAPADIVRAVAGCGLAAVEWGGDVHVPHGNTRVAREVAAMTADAGLACSSYGSYYRGPVSEQDGLRFASVLDTAEALGVDLVRIWAGSTGSAATEPAARAAMADHLRRIAEVAAGRRIRVGLEYHGNTLTDTDSSAAALLAEADHPNLLTYWQPHVDGDDDERVEGLEAVLPRLCALHVFHWQPDPTGRSERRPLMEGRERWRRFLSVSSGADDAGTPLPVLLEFVRGDTLEQLEHDAAVLRELLSSTEA